MAVVLTAVGSLGAWAAKQEVPVKMTYINGTADAVNTAYGAVETAYAGYNKISGGCIALANQGWGVNNVAFLQIDASAVAGPISKVTLSGSFQQISARELWYGFGYNNSTWSDSLTWNTADRTITLIEGAGVSAGKSTADIEGSVDITAAFAADSDKVVTIIVYQTAAGGGYIKNAKAEVEYQKADEVILQYSFENDSLPTLTFAGSRTTANYEYNSPISTGKFVNLWTANAGAAHEVTFPVAKDTITTNGQWTLEYDWAVYDGCNKNAGHSKLYGPAGEVIFDISNPADWSTSASVTLLNTTVVPVPIYGCDSATRGSANTAQKLTADTWKHVTVIGTEKGVTLTIQAYKADSTLSDEYIVKKGKVYATNINPSKLGLTPGRMGSVAIDNLKLTVGDLKSVSYDYTVKFVDQNGDPVKDDVIRSAEEGEALSVEVDDKETIINGKTQYTYVSDDAAERTVDDEGVVLTITYNKTTVANYVVNYLNSSNDTIQTATTHKNVVVGTKVAATAGELSKILAEGTFYNYASGNDSIVVAEDESLNVINLVFAAEEGVTGYFLKTYEDGSNDWTAGTSGRYTPINVNGSGITFRYGTRVDHQAILDSLGNAVLDSLGQPTYKDVTVTDSTNVIEFGNKTRFLGVDQGSRNNNGGAVNHATLGVDQNDFTFEAKVLLGSSNDQAGTNFLIKNYANNANILEVRQNGKNSTKWYINGDTIVDLPNSNTYTGTTLDNLTNYLWYNFKVTVFKGYTFVAITDQNGDAVLDRTIVPTSALTYGVGPLQFNSSRYYANFGIDDIVVRSVTEDDIPAGFDPVVIAVNYVDSLGNVLKPAGTVEFNKGDAIALTSAYTADFKLDSLGNVWTSESATEPVSKYIYVSDNSSSFTADEGVSVNVVFRPATSRRILFRPQIQLTNGTITSKNAAGTNIPLFYDSNKAGDKLFENDVLTYYYPYYLLVDGLLYKTAANGGNDAHGTYTVSAGTNTQTFSPITWTPATETVDSAEVQISNAVFAEETENIEGITVVKDGYTVIRMANGAAGSAIGGDVLVTTLQPGKYTLTTATRSGTTNFTLNGEVVATISSSGTVATITSDEFTVGAPTPLYIAEQANTNSYSDYILIRKTGDVEVYNITLAEVENGEIVLPATATPGDEVIITANATEGYELAEVTVTGTSGETYEVETDEWEGTTYFVMPAEAVTVTATFQQAYVRLSDYAVATDGEFDEDDDVKVVLTYNADIVGSYAESFMLDAQFAYEVREVATGEIVVSSTKNPVNVADGTLNIYISDLQPQTQYSITITGVSVTDFDLSTFESVDVFTETATLASQTFTTGLPTGIANVEAAPAQKADGKYLENGQIVIYKNGVKYNAAGAVIR